MTEDPILVELYRFREELAARFNYNLDDLVAYLREKQAAENRPIVSFCSKRIDLQEESLPEQKAA